MRLKNMKIQGITFLIVVIIALSNCTKSEHLDFEENLESTTIVLQDESKIVYELVESEFQFSTRGMNENCCFLAGNSRTSQKITNIKQYPVFAYVSKFNEGDTEYTRLFKKDTNGSWKLLDAKLRKTNIHFGECATVSVQRHFNPPFWNLTDGVYRSIVIVFKGDLTNLNPYKLHNGNLWPQTCASADMTIVLGDCDLKGGCL